MRRILLLLVAISSGAAFGAAAGSLPIGGSVAIPRWLGEGRPKAAIHLEIEPLLIDASGIHPLNQAYESLVKLGKEGTFHSTYYLGIDAQRTFLYKLSYRLVDDDQIDLTLERSLERKDGGRLESMPPLTHRMQVFDLWSPTVLEEEGTGTRLMLRVTPILRPLVEDVPFESDRFQMWLSGGPLIAYGDRASEDRIIFREMNIGGSLQFGIPGVGEMKLSLKRFPGSAPCGSVHGYSLEFELGGGEYRAYSTRPIMPEDPRRPGGGWILYGSLDPSVNVENGYYGGFSSSK